MTRISGVPQTSESVQKTSTFLLRRLALGTIAGGLIAAVTVLVGAGAYTLEILIFLIFLAAGIALSISDVRRHRLPNKIVFPLYGASFVLLVTMTTMTGDWSRLIIAVLGGIALWGAYFLFGLTGGMSFGDVKLAGVLGFYLAWYGSLALLYATMLTFALSLPHALTLMIRHRHDGTKPRLPFGPYMIVGALATALYFVY